MRQNQLDLVKTENTALSAPWLDKSGVARVEQMGREQKLW